jgi:mycothiol system anti-sigma-R factor
MAERTSERIPVTCERVLSQVWDYLDDRMTPEARTLVQMHMAECPRCSGYEVFQERCRAALAALRARRAPPHLRSRILDALVSAGYAPR